MDLKTLRLLAKYNAQTNEKMNKHISGLTAEMWEKEFGGFFSSIKSLCNHIYISDFNWLKRFSGLRRFNFAEDGVFKETIRFDEICLRTIEEYLTKRKEIDQKYISKFIEELTEDDLEKNLVYKDSHGIDNNKNFGNLVLHMFNHETHHRGMISLYLEELKIKNDYSNLVAIL